MEDFRYTQENTVLVSHNWLEINSNLIQVFNKQHSNKMNFITKVVKVNMEEEKLGSSIKEGDILFLSRYIVTCPKLKLFGITDSSSYSVIPAKLILGKFTNENLTLSNLEMVYDKILIEPVRGNLKSGSIELGEGSKIDIGRVIRKGTHTMFRDYSKREIAVDIGDIVLCWSNVSTPITLNGSKYLAVEENRVIGKFMPTNNDSNDLSFITMENLEMINGRILLKDLVDEKIDITDSIILPNKNNDFVLGNIVFIFILII